ncbi:phage terminase small subunit [Parasalinivibrio latis]|uniref:phage terminase small subunit n=1 Tax=Parasalinivibrio latis TaxID=2952610 RepID=UPI0030E51289
MTSPFQKKKAAILAELAQQAGETLPARATASPDSLHIRLIEFDNDKKALKGFNAIADRVAHKRDVLIPKYRPVAEAYLEAGESYENPIFSALLVWLFDVGEMDTGIDWCLKAIERQLPTPGFLKRDWPTFLADTVFDWAEVQAERGQSVEPYFSQVFEKVLNEWRLHEKVSAKWFKFAGYMLLRDENGKPRATAVGDLDTLEKAYALLARANELHGKIGVGTVMNKVQSRINALRDGKNL